MFGSSQVLNTLMPVFYTSLPILGALLLLYHEDRKDGLDTLEKVASCLIFLGFLLFIGWEVYWIAAILGAAGCIGIIIYSLVRKRLRKVPRNT